LWRNEIEAIPRCSLTAEIGELMSDKLLTLRLCSGKIDAVNGHRYDGPGVEVIVIEDAIATRFTLHNSSPVAVYDPVAVYENK
jgi:hypothetical protein